MSEGEAAPPRRMGWQWYVYLIVLFEMLAYNVHFRSVELSVVDRRDQLQQQHDDQQRRKEGLTSLVSQVRSIASGQAKEIRDLKTMLRRCRSRDEFCVAEGERIVWSPIWSTPRGVRSLCFYVPKGKHRFVYSVNHFLGANHYARSAAITGGDHRSLPESGFVELEGESVYEMRTAIEPEKGREVNISLLDEDATVHSATYPLAHPARVSITHLQNDAQRFIAYPGELKSAGEAKAHVSARKSKPVTGMMTLIIEDLGGRGKESKGRVVMRFWIDSSNGGCMADTTVATGYKFLANMKNAFSPATQHDFEQTFQSYDGSGRFYFRQGYFPEPTPIQGIELPTTP